MKPAITLRDVARMAEVSEITVSRVLRESGAIRPATRERVMEAVRRTGYVPNRLAGGLSSARSNLVGVVLPSLSNNVFPQVMAGINAALASSGFQPVVGVSDYDDITEAKLVRSMLAWKPAALILTGLEHSGEVTRMVSGADLRVVEIMDTDGDPIDTAVGFSHRAAGAATARHLIARGYRRFGYLGHDLSRDRRAAARLDGLAEALHLAGLPPAARHLTQGPSSTGAGREGLAALHGRAPDLDVVVFSNDDMAVGGVFHCVAAGIAVPRDLALFGFNGLEIGQSLPQPLSTLRSDRGRIGQLAVEAILSPPPAAPGGRIIDTGFAILSGATA